MFEYELNKDFIILEQSLSLTFLNPNQLASTKKDHNDGYIFNNTNPQRSGEEEITLDTNHSLHTMFSQLQNLDTLYHVYKYTNKIVEGQNMSYHNFLPDCVSYIFHTTIIMVESVVIDLRKVTMDFFSQKNILVHSCRYHRIRMKSTFIKRIYTSRIRIISFEYVQMPLKLIFLRGG